MRGSGELGALRERLQGAAATALALLVLMLVFAFLVPRREEIAASFHASRRVAASQVPTPAPDETPPDGAAPEAPPVAAAPEAVPQPTPETAALPAPAEAARGAADEETHRRLLARPVALDTATLLVGRGKVRLRGIDAVSLAQRCGDGRDAWYCGAEARAQFRAWLRARSIRCDVPKDFGDQPADVVSTCDLAGEDVGAWLVSNGWATASAGGPYVTAEGKARSAKLGIWAERRAVE